MAYREMIQLIFDDAMTNLCDLRLYFWVICIMLRGNVETAYYSLGIHIIARTSSGAASVLQRLKIASVDQM